MKIKLKLILPVVVLTILFYRCGPKHEENISISPEAGTAFKSGDIVAIQVYYAADLKADSVIYLVDSVKFGVKKDSTAFSLNTDSLPLGPRVISAKVYQVGKSQDVSTNIVLLAAKAPEEYNYKVEKVFPHDTSSYTEGLEYNDGYLYESAGNYKNSSLRKVDLTTGKVVQITKLDPKYFGEGISIMGDKIVQLTYREKVAFVYDKNTFKLLRTFPDSVGVEGWGMCFDGKKLYKDDKTNRIWFLDKDTYHPKGYIEVFDDKGAVNGVNELEYIDNKLYANVYTTDTIVVINPKTGAVLQRVDMKNLWPAKDRPADFDYQNNVLNGIAWDEKGKRLFVTGKKWPHLYQVRFVKK
ncbi:MAG TPA: glutaminyl-peptide cyclotransferase [Mucilaginibacter sp.]